MPLPSPLPDDPRKWDGWSQYISNDPYARLCLDFTANPTTEEIEENSRQLLVWWQKKLPLKNQPSNPMAQMLRGGIDNAPRCITEARTELVNPARRAQIDSFLSKQRRETSLTEFRKFLEVALANKVLSTEAEAYLHRMGQALNLSQSDIDTTIEGGMRQRGTIRAADVPPPEPAPAPAPASEPPAEEFVEEETEGPEEPPMAAQAASDTPRVITNAVRGTRRVRGGGANKPVDDFRRMLELSGLDEDSMSDDRRDTFIDMAENLGLDPGVAEDMVDDYLEAVANGTVPLRRPSSTTSIPASVPVTPLRATSTPANPSARVVSGKVVVTPKAPVVTPRASPPAIRTTTTLSSDDERKRYLDFINGVGMRMLFIPTASFQMGSLAPDAPSNEQPANKVNLSKYFISRFPVTNQEFERFNPAHANKRGAWADDTHPVIYVNAQEAQDFCKWLSAKDRRRYRLPTEAEWEYAAKSGENRIYPWGGETGSGDLANFADANKPFAWRDPNVDVGFAETSPVGSYPRGASPFGVEDMAGNVWEWCLDFYAEYKTGERTNPRGPINGAQRVYRGGSWKSRFSNLRTTARGFNLPTYASNDVGFRIVCECD